MKLPIENWISETVMPDEARIAFYEAVLCFKISAYRASLLFSYLGWNLTLRYRILLLATPPSGFIAGEWTAIQNELRNEDKWDKKLFELVQMRNPTKLLFQVSDDLRQQVQYWKDRRNDCAHFKKNEITSSHVESLWSFIQSNLAKFVPCGSKEAILNQIRWHHDPRFTPPGADISPIINQVVHGITPDEIPSFMDGIIAILTDGTTGLVSERDVAIVVEAIIRLDVDEFMNALVAYLLTHANLLPELFRAHPNRLLLFSNQPMLIRWLWHDVLFLNGKQDLYVFTALIRNNLVPAEQLTEAFSSIVSRLNNDVPNPVDRDALERCGLIDVLRRYTYDDGYINDFAWANRNALTIRWLVESYPITDEIARRLCTVFDVLPYPWHAKDALKALYDQNANKRAEFLAAFGRLPPGHTNPFV